MNYFTAAEIEAMNLEGRIYGQKGELKTSRRLSAVSYKEDTIKLKVDKEKEKEKERVFNVPKSKAWTVCYWPKSNTVTYHKTAQEEKTFDPRCVELDQPVTMSGERGTVVVFAPTEKAAEKKMAKYDAARIAALEEAEKKAEELREKKILLKKQKEQATKIPVEKTYAVLYYQGSNTYVIHPMEQLGYANPAFVKKGWKKFVEWPGEGWFEGQIVDFASTEEEANKIVDKKTGVSGSAAAEQKRAEMEAVKAAREARRAEDKKRKEEEQRIPAEKAWAVLFYKKCQEAVAHELSTLGLRKPALASIGQKVDVKLVRLIPGRIVAFAFNEEEAQKKADEMNEALKNGATSVGGATQNAESEARLTDIEERVQSTKEEASDEPPSKKAKKRLSWSAPLTSVSFFSKSDDENDGEIEEEDVRKMDYVKKEEEQRDGRIEA